MGDRCLDGGMKSKTGAHRLKDGSQNAGLESREVIMGLRTGRTKDGYMGLKRGGRLVQPPDLYMLSTSLTKQEKAEEVGCVEGEGLVGDGCA